MKKNAYERGPTNTAKPSMSPEYASPVKLATHDGGQHGDETMAKASKTKKELDTDESTPKKKRCTPIKTKLDAGNTPKLSEFNFKPLKMKGVE